MTGASLPAARRGSARIHRGLFLSKGHRTNVMGETFREVGLGVRAGEFESDGMPFNSVMVTENFAARGGSGR